MEAIGVFGLELHDGGPRLRELRKAHSNSSHSTPHST